MSIQGGRNECTGPQLHRQHLWCDLVGKDRRKAKKGAAVSSEDAAASTSAADAANTAAKLRHFCTLMSALFPSSKDLITAFQDKKGFPLEAFCSALKGLARA